METSHSAARSALLGTISRLEKVVPDAVPEMKLVLQAVTPHLQSFETTFGREVSAFCRPVP
jgi:hypothetical protein